MPRATGRRQVRANSDSDQEQDQEQNQDSDQEMQDLDQSGRSNSNRNRAAAGPFQPVMTRVRAQELMNELKPQPLDRSAETGLSSQANNYKSYVQSMMVSLGYLKDAVIADEDLKTGKPFDEDDDQVVAAADRDTREMIDMLEEARIREKALKEIAAKISRGEEVRNAKDEYCDILERELAAYKGKTSRQKYMKSKEYEQFRNDLWEPRREERGQQPALSDLLQAEPGDDDDSDDEIRMGAVTKDYKCPITLTLLENPVTHQKCNHSYSKGPVTELVQTGERRCPVSGCGESISMSSWKEDKALAKAVQAHKRRLEQKEESRRATQAQGATMID